MSKKVRLTLVGLDGNAFALMGYFQRAARDQGWTEEEIDKILEECQKKDYNHLLRTLIQNCVDEDTDCDTCGGGCPECGCDNDECTDDYERSFGMKRPRGEEW